MSGVKHTPGPWYCRQQFANRWLIEKDQGFNADGEKLVPLGLASVHTTILEVGCSDKDTAANARLIAAAPDMFDYILSSAQNGCATAQEIITRATGPDTAGGGHD